MSKSNLIEARTRLYSRRDSATKVLKTMGIAAADYNQFIEPADDGQFICHLDKAKHHLEWHASDPKQEKKPSKPRAPRAPKPKVVAPPKPVVPLDKLALKGAISEVIKKMIIKGMSNSAIRDELGLDPRRQHYPGWYRCKMRREGLDV